ncbi:MAG: deoxyribose-phosphate aldolase [Treponema sp.]|nr:deoxyribose-phosphate aldolase [Candidatus Treponema equi]
MTKTETAAYIDQTLLAPTATEEELIAFVNKSKDYGFASVCINPVYIKKAKELLAGTSTKVCTVIDFPLGAGGIETKQTQADIAIDLGADELDFVIDLGLVKAHKWTELKAQLTFIVKGVKEASMFREDGGAVLTKLILETCCLTDEEIVESCKCAKEAGFDFVKTSTGFYSAKPNGATVHAVELMRKTVGPDMGVKASGGIHSYEEAMAMIKAGATRIGASAGIEIVSQAE